MAIRRIRQLGDPILRVRCERTQDPKSPAIRLVADDLRDTLKAARKRFDMGRAMAAPQIGAPVRVVVVEIPTQMRSVTVNPEMPAIGRDSYLVLSHFFRFPNL